MEKIIIILIIIIIIYLINMNSKGNEVESFNNSEKDFEKIRSFCSDPKTGNIDINCVRNMISKGNEIDYLKKIRSFCSDPKTGNIDLDCVRNMQSKGNEIESFNNIDRMDIIYKLNAYASEEDRLLNERNTLLLRPSNDDTNVKIDSNTNKLREVYKNMNAISNDVNILTGMLFNVDLEQGTRGVVPSTLNYVVRQILSAIIEKC
jgi:hypothetical protein